MERLRRHSLGIYPIPCLHIPGPVDTEMKKDIVPDLKEHTVWKRGRMCKPINALMLC